MNKVKHFFWFVVLICALCGNTQALAGGGAAGFLMIPISARANGMGGASITLVDEESAYNNPGALGLFHMKKRLSITTPSVFDGWLPKFSNQLRLRYASFSAGKREFLNLGDDKKPSNVSAGFALSAVRLSYGTITRTSELGDTLGTENPYDFSGAFSLGFGADLGVRVGLGFSLQYVKTLLASQGVGPDPVSASDFASNFGFILEAPLVHLLGDGNKASSSESTSGWEITPVIAHVRTFISGEFRFLDAAQVDPVVKKRRSSVALEVTKDSFWLRQFSARFVYERETDGSDISGAVLNRYGIELGALNTAFARIGKINRDQGGPNVLTYGFGASLRGLLDLINGESASMTSDSESLSFGESFDLRVDFARFTGDFDQSLDGTNFLRLTASI